LQLIPALEQAKKKFDTLVDKNQLRGELVKVTIGTLSPQQAIGNPTREDFALLARSHSSVWQARAFQLQPVRRQREGVDVVVALADGAPL